MQAVILAGGKGTRLAPLTDRVPKPMVLIHNKPFLQYQLELLRRRGFSNVILCVGHLANVVKDCFGDGSALGITISYSTEETLLGTAGALRLAYNELEEEFILLNGDTYLDIPYQQVIDFHKKERAGGTVVVYNNLLKLADNNIVMHEDRTVSYYGVSGRSNCVDAGVYIFSRDSVETIREGQQISLEDGILNPLIREKRLLGFSTAQRYYDIGTFDRIKVFEKEVAGV